MQGFDIEFCGDAGRVHNARFADDRPTGNQVLVGIFYEDVPLIVADIRAFLANDPGREVMDYDFGDFISGQVSMAYTTLRPDCDAISSLSYRVRTKDLLGILEVWVKFSSRNRNGVTKRVVIEAETW